MFFMPHLENCGVVESPPIGKRTMKKEELKKIESLKKYRCPGMPLQKLLIGVIQADPSMSRKTPTTKMQRHWG